MSAAGMVGDGSCTEDLVGEQAQLRESMEQQEELWKSWCPTPRSLQM